MKRQFQKFTTDIDRHEIFLLSGSLAYTTSLALAPFMLIMLFVASLLGSELQQKLTLEISNSLGDKAGGIVSEIVKHAHENNFNSNLSGIVGFFILAISASAIFSQLRISLDKINDYHLPRSSSGFWVFVKDKVFSFGLVFGFIFLSIVSLIFSTLVSAMFGKGDGWMWQSLLQLGSLLMFTFLFAMIYRFVPTSKFDWRRSRISGFVSAVFYLLGKMAISIYLAHAGLESSYGAAGSFVAFLSCEVTNHFVVRSKRWPMSMVA
jgi:membrane protein